MIAGRLSRRVATFEQRVPNTTTTDPLGSPYIWEEQFTRRCNMRAVGLSSEIVEHDGVKTSRRFELRIRSDETIKAVSPQGWRVKISDVHYNITSIHDPTGYGRELVVDLNLSAS